MKIFNVTNMPMTTLRIRSCQLAGSVGTRTHSLGAKALVFMGMD